MVRCSTAIVQIGLKADVTPCSGVFWLWSGQLRQPILLATRDAVIGRAPIEGFLHPTNNLDTLGLDEALSPCR